MNLNEVSFSTPVNSIETMGSVARGNEAETAGSIALFTPCPDSGSSSSSSGGLNLVC